MENTNNHDWSMTFLSNESVSIDVLMVDPTNGPFWIA